MDAPVIDPMTGNIAATLSSPLVGSNMEYNAVRGDTDSRHSSPGRSHHSHSSSQRQVNNPCTVGLPTTVLNMIERDDASSGHSSARSHSSASTNSRRANNPYAVGAAVSPKQSGGFERRSQYVSAGGGSSRNSSTHLAFDIGGGGSSSDPQAHPHSPPSVFPVGSTFEQMVGQLPAPRTFSDGRWQDDEGSCSSSSAQSLHHQYDPIYNHSVHPQQDHPLATSNTNPLSPQDQPPYPRQQSNQECHPLAEHHYGAGWSPLDAPPPPPHQPAQKSNTTVAPAGSSVEVRSLDSSRASMASHQMAGTQQRRPRNDNSLSPPTHHPGGMSQVAIATASAPSQGPTDTSSDELADMLRAAYRSAYGSEFDLRTAGPDGRPDETNPAPPPPPQPSVDVKCPSGFVFSVYDTDVREHFSVESKDVVITAGAIKYVEYFAKYGYQTRFRFQYCKRFVSGRCTTGNNCHFLHVASLPASTSVHVNENAATSHPTAPVNAQMVVGGVNTHRYPTMPAGVVFQVYPPNTSSSAPQLITSSQVLHTAGAASVYGLLSTQQRKYIERQRQSQQGPYQQQPSQLVSLGEDNELSALSVERVVHFPPDKRASNGGRTIVIRTPSTPPPPPQGLRPRHCAHFQFKRLCNLGTECNFIHALVPFIQGVALARCNPNGAHAPPPHHISPPPPHQQLTGQYAPTPQQHHHQQMQQQHGGFLPPPHPFQGRSPMGIPPHHHQWVQQQHQQQHHQQHHQQQQQHQQQQNQQQQQHHQHHQQQMYQQQQHQQQQGGGGVHHFY